MVSFDIPSLFINVPLDDVISFCADFLYHSPLTSVPSFPESIFVELMELVTKWVSFSFNDTMYCQVDGISLGSPFGPIFLNIFVGFLEKLLFERFSKPYIYLRYVDDTFTCFSSYNEALSPFHCLSDLHPSLAFAMDVEKDNKLLFLDVLVECCSFAFVTCTYRKPTFTGLYLSWNAFACKSRKVNLIKVSHIQAFLRFFWVKVNLNELKIYFWVMGILRKSLLTPLTKLLISLRITLSHLALLNAQFMLDFLGLDWIS